MEGEQPFPHEVKLSSIIAQAFTLYRDNFLVLAAISALAFLGNILTVNLTQQYPQGWVIGLTAVMNYFLAVWVCLALIQALAALVRGEAIRLPEAFARGRGHFWMYLFVATFTGLAAMFGFVLLILPGIYLSVVFYLASISAVVDQQSFFDHLKISRLLMKGYFWKGFGLILFSLICMFAHLFLSTLGWDQYLTTVLMYGINFLVMPFYFALVVILYNQLRTIKQADYAAFAGQVETKGSQLGLGILSCIGLGIMGIGLLTVVSIGSMAAVSYFTGAGKICPLPTKPKSEVQYLKAADKLTRTPQEAKLVETEAYYLYIPAGTDIDKKHPMVILLSPVAKPKPLIAAWQPAADKYKWILYGSKEYSNSGGGMYQQSWRIVSLLDEIYDHFPVDRTMVMAAGLSGGGMGAHEFAKFYPNTIQAVIANTGMMYANISKTSDGYSREKYAVFLASPTDFRYEEMQQDYQRLKDLDWQVQWIEFKGGHIMAPPEAYVEAADWLQKHLIEGHEPTEAGADPSKALKETFPDGVHQEFYPNGNLSVETTFKDGLRHGPYVSYYHNGDVWSEGEYVRDKKHGEFTVYNDDGSLQRITQYDEGIRNGWSKDFDDGMLVEDNLYRHDVMVLHQHYKGERLVHVEEFVDGEMVKATFYDDDGQEEFSIDYKDGVPQYDFWKMLWRSFK